MTKFTEEKLEQAIIALLEQQGYPHHPGDSLARGPAEALVKNDLQALKAEKASFADLDIDFEEKAFYDILKGLAVKYDFIYAEDKLIALSKAVKAVVDDKARYTDWNRRDDIKAELKVGLILVLAKHGYPPVDRDEVYKEIFEQAENFKRYQSAGQV